MIFKTLLSAVLIFMVQSYTAMAQTGKPEPWGINMQNAASPSADYLHSFHDMMIYIITAISVFVLILLMWVVIRYNKRANPVPSKTSHNLAIEILWTLVPVLILLVIALPSMRMLYFLDRTEDPDMTLKITGYQWYWGYEYPDHEGINFLSYMIPDDEINEADGQVRLLSVDNPIVLPVDTNVQILMTGGDVIHSWTVPSLGVKIDAIPGKINETWVRITKPGTYYGQCSELCGKAHAYMPIEIRAVSKEDFDAWVGTAKEEFSAVDIIKPTQFAYLEDY